jgi:sec-independent protein translocase protein TatA
VIGDILQPSHLLFVLVIALLVLGPKRLPEVGRSLGRGIRDFRGALSGDDQDEPEIPEHSQYAPPVPDAAPAPPATDSAFAQPAPPATDSAFAQPPAPATDSAFAQPPAPATDSAVAQPASPATPAPKAPSVANGATESHSSAEIVDPAGFEPPTEARSAAEAMRPARLDDAPTRALPVEPAEQHIS